MRFAHAIRNVSLVLGLIVLAACGGGGGSVGGGGGGGGPMDPTVRSAALVKVGQYVTSQYGVKSHQEYLQGLVDLMKSMPEFKEAGLDPTTKSVWAVFSDGVPMAFWDNEQIDPGAPFPEEIPSLETSAKIATPSKKQYRVINTLGNAFQSDAGKIAGMLGPLGYVPAARSSGLVEHLMTDIDESDGLVYYEAHSGTIKLDATTPPQNSFGISTSSPVTVQNVNEEPFKSLLASGYIGTGWAVDRMALPGETDGTVTSDLWIRGRHALVPRYYITPIFINRYFKFARASLWIQNSCTSFNTAARHMFSAKKLGAYVGWNDLATDGCDVILRRLIDRMAGTNKEIPDETPEFRPFPIDQTVTWMAANGLDRISFQHEGNTHTPTLQYEVFDNYGLLAPTIKSIRIDESWTPGVPDLMSISGVFGPYNDVDYVREVVVNGQQLRILSGSEKAILCEIPTNGAGSEGPCFVRVNGIQSNTVPITTWNIKFNYLLKNPLKPAYINVDANVWLRADAHLWRNVPADDPVGKKFYFKIRGDSKATWRAAGMNVEDGVSHTLSGNGEITPRSGGLNDNFQGTGVIDTKAMTVELFYLYMWNQYANDHTSTPDGNGGFIIKDYDVPVLLTLKEGYVKIKFEPTGSAGNLNAGAYQILPGQQTIGFSTITGGLTNMTATMKWDRVIPNFPPTDDTKSSWPGDAR